MRPTPGDRGSWSHAPIARVQPRAGGTPEPAPPPPAPPPVQAQPQAPVRPPYPGPRTYPPLQPGRSPLPGPYRAPQPGIYRAPLPGPSRQSPPIRTGFGLPNLRRNVCPHFYMTGPRGAIPIQAPHLLKGLLRQPNNVSRCQLRGGVHLDEGYVNDVCLTPRFNQCVFYEDELTKE